MGRSDDTGIRSSDLDETPENIEAITIDQIYRADRILTWLDHGQAQIGFDILGIWDDALENLNEARGMFGKSLHIAVNKQLQAVSRQQKKLEKAFEKAYTRSGEIHGTELTFAEYEQNDNGSISGGIEDSVPSVIPELGTGQLGISPTSGEQSLPIRNEEFDGPEPLDDDPPDIIPNPLLPPTLPPYDPYPVPIRPPTDPPIYEPAPPNPPVFPPIASPCVRIDNCPGATWLDFWRGLLSTAHAPGGGSTANWQYQPDVGGSGQVIVNPYNWTPLTIQTVPIIKYPYKVNSPWTDEAEMMFNNKIESPGDMAKIMDGVYSWDNANNLWKVEEIEAKESIMFANEVNPDDGGLV